jgi:ParB-like chromosome segregation protein Spo0J
MRVPISQLRFGESPRLSGPDHGHIRALGETLADLPPINVHRATMTVIDGVHRLLAARARGEKAIFVRFFDGDPEEAFVLAVRANIAHGRPLTLQERERATVRILRVHPEWSDRALASIVGLSPKTVGVIRRRASEEIPQSPCRVGMDGRVRAIDSGSKRHRIAELLARDPSLSLRRVAVAAGSSVATVRDVRARLVGGQPISGPIRRVEPANDVQEVRQPVSGDSACSSTEEGRDFAEWFDRLAVDEEEWSQYLDAVPLSRVYEVSEVARSRAQIWAGFADALEQRARSGRAPLVAGRPAR